MENPTYLYHYTNIDALALILKNQTIRLNPLDKMDDLQEKETADIKNIGQFFYVSSWTEEEEESIPMWNMYTKIDAGVRIKLKTNPFKRCGTKIPFDADSGINIPKGSMDTYLPLDELMKKNCYTVEAFNGNILKKITYTSDKSLLYPSVYRKIDEKQFFLEFASIGIYKNLHWAFQKEWRYIIMFYPLKFGDVTSTILNLNLIANKMYLGIEEQPFPYYDLQIEEKAFSQMEITLSPKISNGNKELIINTIYKYNSKIQIKESVLIGLI